MFQTFEASLRSLANLSLPNKIKNLARIYKIIHRISSFSDDVIGGLEAVLLVTFVSFRRDDVGSNVADGSVEIVKVLKTRLLDRFHKNPAAFVDHLLKVSDEDMVIKHERFLNNMLRNRHETVSVSAKEARISYCLLLV